MYSENTAKTKHFMVRLSSVDLILL